MKRENKITTLYEHYKNTPKKLKIVCDWDEVIQACEPYALWEAVGNVLKENIEHYDGFIERFWEQNNIEYSPYGSKIKKEKYSEEVWEEQQAIKNSPNFYQQAPFLTIAEDLLKLIKEDKIEQIIFLSAYDKRKFPNGDERKLDIFHQTFGSNDDEAEKNWVRYHAGNYRVDLQFQLIGFDDEQKGQTKADWIKQNASDFDIVIDDNPNICRSLAGAFTITVGEILGKWKEIKVIAPYYPAIENQHDKEVVLVKNEVSELKMEDFSK